MTKQGPKYIQVYNKLRADLTSGKYSAGSFLPTENELMKTYDASRTTIRHAISLLKEENLIQVKQGRGTEVQKSEDMKVLSHFRNATSVDSRFLNSENGVITKSDPIIDVVPAEIRVAEALGIGIGEKVYRLQRMQYVDGKAYSYMLHYIPIAIVPDLLEKTGQVTVLYDFLRKNYGIEVISSEEVIDVMSAGFMEVQLLKVEQNTPLMVLRRISNRPEGPLEYSETIIRPDMFQIYISFDVTKGFMGVTGS